MVKEYVGAGPAADRTARHDALTRNRRASATETVRRLAGPTVQVNIARKQVNVAGGTPAAPAS
ncbi:MAG: hypothetical protein K2X87_21100 [Gemmataceae bacterium]|nr:hypothetical protein [Gemmataceae bacterium]